jgi:hypothetical protein
VLLSLALARLITLDEPCPAGGALCDHGGHRSSACAAPRAAHRCTLLVDSPAHARDEQLLAGEICVLCLVKMLKVRLAPRGRLPVRSCAA